MAQLHTAANVEGEPQHCIHKMYITPAIQGALIEET